MLLKCLTWLMVTNRVETRSYLSEGNSVSFPERCSVLKRLMFRYLVHEKAGVIGIYAITTQTLCFVHNNLMALLLGIPLHPRSTLWFLTTWCRILRLLLFLIAWIHYFIYESWELEQNILLVIKLDRTCLLIVALAIMDSVIKSCASLWEIWKGSDWNKWFFLIELTASYNLRGWLIWSDYFNALIVTHITLFDIQYVNPRVVRGAMHSGKKKKQIKNRSRP